MFNKIEKYIDEISRALRNPGLLVVSGSQSPNIMAINLGLTGYLWARPVFTLAIKKARHTYKLIDESGVFTVNVPRKDLYNEIMKIAAISGSDVDKFNEFHLHPVKAKNIDTYIVGDCGIHLECRVIYKSPVDGGLLDADIKNHIYEGRTDYHTLFCGEILDIYET